MQLLITGSAAVASASMTAVSGSGGAAHNAVDAPQMFVEVFLPREAEPGAAFAKIVWAHERPLQTAMFAVHFALVAQQAARVSEAA
jgi:hypothetical protein